MKRKCKHIISSKDGKRAIYIDEDNYEEIKKQYLELSQRRVEAVANYLTNSGVAASRISTKAFGGSKPLVAAKYSEKNRRVELKITKIE